MAAIEHLRVDAVTIPTDQPESDGTLAWDSTGVVTVEIEAGGQTGLGWTYNDPVTARLIEQKLAPVVCGRDPLDVPEIWMAMRAELRNIGATGLGASAISAVDVALWDLAARLRGVSLAQALGSFRDSVAVYGSGGFCSYDDETLAGQLRGWVEQGIGMVKIKVGREPEADPHRVSVAREAIGDEVELFVDANGAYDRRQAISWTTRFASLAGITWMEEPVSSDDRTGLRQVREAAPPAVAVTAGEYAWAPIDALDLLEATAVDVLQLDATRCLGLTGFRAAAALAAARGVPISAHCSPALHLHACCACERVEHIEYFHDHVRIEAQLFGGVPSVEKGHLAIDKQLIGHGLTLNRAAIGRYS